MKETEKIVASLLVLGGAIALTVYAFLEISDSVDAAMVVLPLVNGSGACKKREINILLAFPTSLYSKWIDTFVELRAEVDDNVDVGKCQL
jgi:hypothetical protein